MQSQAERKIELHKEREFARVLNNQPVQNIDIERYECAAFVANMKSEDRERERERNERKH